MTSQIISVENSHLYTGTGLDWNVAVLYRRYDPDHASSSSSSWTERWFRRLQFAWDQHGPYNHVELLFRLQGGGDIPCPCVSFPDKEPKKVHLHRVSYSASWSKKRVYKQYDRSYATTKPLWDIQRLMVADPNTVSAMLAFLESQIDQPFGTRSMIQNFSGLGPLHDRVSATRLAPVSTKPFQASPHGLLKRDKTWFCSELVTATLIYGGIIDPEKGKVEPSRTNPQTLCDLRKECTLMSDLRPTKLSTVLLDAL